MFHIKTDIRQYKCESEEKVKLLIRNWVIRPTDLIYDPQRDAWETIGEHGAFEEIFAIIEQEEANEPDTVVTEAPSELALEYEVAPGTEHVAEVEQGAGVGHMAAPAPISPAAAPAAPLQPPEAPAGVEGLIRDSDEITMMTDKTLDMLREQAQPQPSTPEPVDPESPDKTRELEVPGHEHEPEIEVDPAPDEPSRGRHGLPEEVFVTDEIHREDIHDAVLDELGALDTLDKTESAEIAASPADDEEVTQLVERDQFFDEDEDPDAQAHPDEDDLDALEDPEHAERPGPRARWRIVMADGDETPDESGDAEESDEDAEEADDAEKDGDPPEKSRGDRPGPVDDDELDAMLNEAAALVGLNPALLREDAALSPVASEDEDAEDIPADALDPVDGEDEGDAKEDDPTGRDRAETPVQKSPPPDAFVSDGYKIALPIDVSPSAEDLRLGLKHSRLGREAKDAAFPHPTPQTPGRLVWREFDLDPPAESRDHSLLFVVGSIVCLALVLFVVITIFG